MTLSWPFARHSRWLKQLDAYADGELRADDARRFDEHLAECSRCASEVAERRELKRMAAALPQLPAPRSFRITPGMLVEPQARAEQRGRPAVMRLAQVTAGLATVAFAAVLAADLSQSGDDGSGQLSTADLDGAEPMSSGAEPEKFATVTPSITLASDDDSAELPDLDEGPAGSGVEPTPADAGSLYEPPGEQSQRTTGDDATDAGDAAPPADGRESSVSIEASDDDNGLSGFVIAEIALGGLAVVAAVTWLATRRARGA